MSLPPIRQEDLKSYSVVDTSTEKVYKSTYGPTHCSVFIKRLSLASLSERSKQMVVSHVEYINKITSEHMTQIVGIYQTPYTLGIITEWMPNGSLHSLIYQRDLYPVLPVSVCMRILRDVAEGLTFLHSLHSSIMYQRLKPCNILLDAQYHVKLSDVQLPNLPKRASMDQDKNIHKAYMSPQRLKGDNPTMEDDIYSLGVITHEALNRKSPFNDNNPLKWATLVQSGYRPQPNIDVILRNSNLSQSQRTQLSQFINLCWHYNPNMRPTAAECLSSLRNIMQTFSVEESKREMDNFVNRKEMAMQDSQYQTCTVEYDIKLLDDSWTSHRDRTQSTPEVSICSGIKEKRNSLPVSSLTNCSHISTMGPCPRAVWKNGVRWTQAEPVDYSTHPQSCVETLKKKREVLLNSITEGQLNQIIDTMRSNFLLSRDDAENINAEKTLKPRIRKCMEICCEKGEEASRKVLNVLHSRNIIS